MQYDKHQQGFQCALEFGEIGATCSRRALGVSQLTSGVAGRSGKRSHWTWRKNGGENGQERQHGCLSLPSPWGHLSSWLPHVCPFLSLPSVYFGWITIFLGTSLCEDHLSSHCVTVKDKTPLRGSAAGHRRPQVDKGVWISVTLLWFAYQFQEVCLHWRSSYSGGSACHSQPANTGKNKRQRWNATL